jgi:hypothetical protein
MKKYLQVVLALAIITNIAFAQISITAVLDTIQHTAFNFFWNEANPANGLIKDRSLSGAPCSIASVGFGLSAICIGVDHGWVTREAARDRVARALQTLWQGPQGSGNGYTGQYGLFYHFLDMSTGTRTWNSELSSIDTGLLLAGIIDARQYFDGTDSAETALRALADAIYQRMNWDLMRNFNPGIFMAWDPVTGFKNYGTMKGYYEASIVYILAGGSPTYPIDADGWKTWTSGYTWVNYFGYQYVGFAPLFGHQYTHCWVDFRNIADEYMRAKGITYFENSRRATLAQRAYAVANPYHHAGYSDSLWGITASDTPTGYSARGAPPAENDEGTITPTAPISSIAFAPAEVLPVIRNLWNTYRAQLWTAYGFRDAFNLNVNWWDSDIIGIDQGPMILMIENYRTGKVWDRFMKNPNVRKGLEIAGFLPLTGVEDQPRPLSYTLEHNYPNPFNPATSIVFTVPSAGRVRLAVFDLLGRVVAVLVDGDMPRGRHTVPFDGSGMASGMYVYRITAGTFTESRTMMMLK